LYVFYVIYVLVLRVFRAAVSVITDLVARSSRRILSK